MLVPLQPCFHDKKHSMQGKVLYRLFQSSNLLTTKKQGSMSIKENSKYKHFPLRKSICKSHQISRYDLTWCIALFNGSHFLIYLMLNLFKKENRLLSCMVIIRFDDTFQGQQYIQFPCSEEQLTQMGCKLIWGSNKDTMCVTVFTGPFSC